MQKKNNGIVRTAVAPPPPPPEDAMSRITARTLDSEPDSKASSTPAINPDSARQKQSRKRAPTRKPMMFHIQPAVGDALRQYCDEFNLVQSAVVEDFIIEGLRAFGRYE